MVLLIPLRSTPPASPVHTPPLQPQHHAYGSQHPMAGSSFMGHPSTLATASYQPQYEYGFPSEAHSDPRRDQPMQWTASSYHDAQSRKLAGHTHSGYAPSSIEPSPSPENPYGSGPIPSTSFQGRMLPPSMAGSKRRRSTASTASSERSRSTKKNRVDQAIIDLELEEQGVKSRANMVHRWYKALHNQTPEAQRANSTALAWESLFEKDIPQDPIEIEGILRLRMPDLGDPVLNLFNSTVERYIKARQNAQSASAPTPSEFADYRCWQVHQAQDPILCFRPSTATGLPIQVLYEGFRQFLVDVRNPHFDIPRSARQVAERLCNSMGNAFNTEDERARTIEWAVQPLWWDWTSEFCVNPFDDRSYRRADRTGLLVKVELEDGGISSSAYMQLCLCFRLYVQSCIKKGHLFVDAGCPTFLLIIRGEELMINGAFWDGERCTVESLIDGGLLMLRDYSGQRQAKLAHALAALHKAHMKILRIARRSREEPDKNKIPCGPGRTPQAYRTCTLYDAPETQATLRFLRQWESQISQPVWLAEMTTTSDTGSSSTTEVIVKLPRTYGADVHRYLHRHDYAPKLLGYTKLPEVPSVYIMEYLQPPWKTLFNLIRTDSALFLRHEQKIFNKITAIIDCLTKGGIVHGNLRSNNIMVHRDALVDEDVQIKVVEFDWSGVAGVANYPGKRPNTGSIPWPGEDGGTIEAGHDDALFSSWWDSELQAARRSAELAIPHSGSLTEEDGAPA